jgi:hypothetical protein
MIGYVTLGSNDREKANAFYDALFSVIGVCRMMEEESFVAWGAGMGSPGLSVCSPFDGNPATSGNGTMVALTVDSNEKVDQMYNKPLKWVVNVKAQRVSVCPDFMQLIFVI